MSRIPVAITLGLLSLSLQAQWFNQPTAGIPRTPDGKPNLAAPAPKTADGKRDFSGTWSMTSAGGGLRQLKPSEIQPWAETLRKQRDEKLGNENPVLQCLPSGFLLNGLVKIVQTPLLIVILSEDLAYRQVFLDGRQLPKDPNPAWMGYAVGHWDGDDTLVVESTGYNDRTWLGGGYPHTENLRVTERWHRGDFGHLDVEIVNSDPAIYQKPWTSKVAGLYQADTDLIEYVCAENEKDRVHLVGKKSDDKPIKLAPEKLAPYAGTYELRAKELTSVDLVLIKIALEDGELRMGLGDGPKQPMAALSETTFTGFGSYIDFEKNDKGETTHFVIHIPDGDFRANRKTD